MDLEVKKNSSVRTGTQEALECQGTGLPTDLSELAASTELLIDVTPQICTPNRVIDGCVEFLETNRVNEESVQAFRLLLSEALANAIEHGTLRLSSTLKEDPLHPYNEVLKNRLKEIKPGQVFLKVRLLHEHGNCEAIMAIDAEVTDSGPGFDWRAHVQNLGMPDPNKPYGRGLALINMIADRMSFNESGNAIRFIVDCSLGAPKKG
jgi:anti-sigma regulatory factor (Ser/Thr protein kinase)